MEGIFHSLVDLSLEIHDTPKQLEARIHELERGIRMMKIESVTQFGEGFIGYIKIREEITRKRIAELEKLRKEKQK